MPWVDLVLFCSCLFILGGCLYLSMKLRFVQCRYFPLLFSLLKKSSGNEGHFTVSPQKALFTAMSTTLGISTIVAPIIAIRLGGPGAMLGFLLTSFFGSAATFTEVSLSVRFRQVGAEGISGGPMPYLHQIFSAKIAKWYAGCCLILMMAWSGAQANQLAAILNAPILGAWRVPTSIAGILIALFVMIILVGGIKRIGAFSAKLVPLIFILYLGALFWILFLNIDQWGRVLSEIFSSAFSLGAMSSGVLTGGFVSALRWGVFKGLQSNEAGIGTQTIPHSLAETRDPETQGALAMLSTFMAGFVAFLSGFVALITETWKDPSLPLGISMVIASFQHYFSYFGVVIVAVSTLLFGFGTILGNSFNGSHCFSYLTKRRGLNIYFCATVLMIFVGALAEVKTFWSLIDLVLAGMAIPHMAALILYVRQKVVLSKNSPYAANAPKTNTL